MNDVVRHKPGFSAISGLEPQAEMLETIPRKKHISIGIPKEDLREEKRIALVPEAVELLVNNGHRVLLERDAGTAAYFTNEQYAAAGAEIMETKDEIYRADLILKISPPSLEDIERLDPRKCLISSLNLPMRDKSYFERLMSKRLKALAFEKIQDKSGAYPVIRSMSEVIGNTVVFIAAEYLCHPEYGKGIMFGGFPGITPSRVVIIGAGTVAEYAARTALGMGANVKVFDNSIYKLRAIQNSLGHPIFTSILQPSVLGKEIASADVVIAAKHSNTGVSPCLIPSEMVKQMKSGSVVVDVSIDQGGCFETSRPTTHQQPVYKESGVTHYCVPNIAAKVPHTASFALSNFLTPTLLEMGEMGGLDAYLLKNTAFAKGTYIYNGMLTNQVIADRFHMPFKDLELLMAAFR